MLISQLAQIAAVHKTIREARNKVLERQAREREAKEREANEETTPSTTPATSTTPGPTSTEQKKAQQTPRDQTSIIPYSIINCITQLDNIYETRLFGWVMAKAQSVLKLYNKDLSEINLQHALGLTRVTLPARMLLNPDDKNYKNITKSFGLSLKKISYEKNNHEYHLNIIAFPELVKDGRKSMVTFVIHSEIWHALLDFSKGHRTFSLPAYIRLTNKYSVIMYLLVSQQTNPMSYNISTLKSLLGCQDYSSYNRGSNFVTKVIDPAREELMSKAPYYFDYSCTKSGSSHAISEIVIIPQVNDAAPPTDGVTLEETMRLRLRLEDNVRVYCEENFKIKPQPLGRIEPLIVKLGDTAAQLNKLSQIKEQCDKRRVTNRAGYLTRSIKNFYRSTE